jgi:hypothetical protein
MQNLFFLQQRDDLWQMLKALSRMENSKDIYDEHFDHYNQCHELGHEMSCKEIAERMETSRQIYQQNKEKYFELKQKFNETPNTGSRSDKE